jgi:hypothetical protein
MGVASGTTPRAVVAKKWNDGRTTMNMKTLMMVTLGACVAAVGCDSAPATQGQAPGGPVVISETSSAITFTPSASVTHTLGLARWEVSRTDAAAEAKGFGADGRTLADLRFVNQTDGTSHIVDVPSGLESVLDAKGANVRNALPASAQASLDALTTDATTLKLGVSAPAPAPAGFEQRQSAVDLHLACSKCYGIIEFCGDLNGNDETGALECDGLSRCGWCFGFW